MKSYIARHKMGHAIACPRPNGLVCDMTKDTSFKASCHCGSVKITIASQPEFMQDCNCSLCSNSGGVWGYLNPAAVKVEGETKGYIRKDNPQPAVEIRFCNICGATTH